MFSAGALCAGTHIGINFNRAFQLASVCLGLGSVAAAFWAVVVLDNYDGTGKRKQGAGVQ